MSKYIKLMDLIDTDCILLGEIECDDCPFYDKERIWCRLIEWINSLPTVNIVTCGMCENNKRNTDGEDEDWCLKFGYEIESDDWCSQGERKYNE